MYSLLFCVFGLFHSSDSSANKNIDAHCLNEISQKACHNCYDLQYSKSIQEALDNVNAIEIDFYDSKNILNAKGAVPYHWFVRHEGENKAGNNNCCYSSVTGANDLDSCLKDVAKWCSAHPKHELITVFLDKKQSWSAQHTPADLDHLLLKYFDQNMIFKPSDLKGSFPSARVAATSGNWPKYQELKGKVIFSLTGGNLLHGNKTLSEYVNNRMDNALIFMAPITKKEKEIYQHPKGMTKADEPYLVFYNFNINHANLTCITKKEKLISRVFNVKENKGHYSAEQSCTNYVAVFDFKNANFSTIIIRNNENR